MMFEIYVKVPDVEAKVGGLFAMVSSLAREWRYNKIELQDLSPVKCCVVRRGCFRFMK